MRRSYNLSAAQMAMLGAAGGLVAAIGFLFATPLHTARIHHHHFAVWATLFIVLVVPGYSLLILASSRLRSGIIAGRCKQQEVESLRAWIHSPVTMALMLSLIAGFITYAILLSHQQPIAWVLFILAQTLSALKNAIPSNGGPNAQRPVWSNFNPIRSEHWGKH